MPLYPTPPNLPAPASDAQQLFDAHKFHEAISLCDKELAELAKQLKAPYKKLPQDADPASAQFQYYALTLIDVNALAELEEWKAAKETLGKYRVHFPRDPWGFRAGAEVTRRDPQVKDKAAVNRAVELLEGEALRLEQFNKE